MEKFNTLEETLDYLKSLDDFNIVSKFKACEDCVYAEDEDQLSIIHLFDRRLIERFEVTEHVEKVVRDRTALQHVSNILQDYLDAKDIIAFSLTLDNSIHIKFEDERVLLVEVFYFEDNHLTLEVAAKYRIEDDQTFERISLSTKDRIELKDLFDTIEKFDQRANRLIEASKI
jgi:hypothetical protein